MCVLCVCVGGPRRSLQNLSLYTDPCKDSIRRCGFRRVWSLFQTHVPAMVGIQRPSTDCLTPGVGLTILGCSVG